MKKLKILLIMTAIFVSACSGPGEKKEIKVGDPTAPAPTDQTESDSETKQ
ncbi:hypothetical protein [Alkalihalobacillus sp. AL-G]|nr:hypothetical protein [Alkalihalobacillus sp. AL-G]WLD94258.1 hypothetical protein MOJ78_05025 [Alkalihalobacillus sp. AL-G]